MRALSIPAAQTCLRACTILAGFGLLLNLCGCDGAAAGGFADGSEFHQPSNAPPPAAHGGGHMSAIEPTEVIAGSPDLALTVSGEGFDVEGHVRSYVIWTADGVATLLVTAPQSPTQLTATVPAALMAQAVVAQIAVIEYDPMGDGPLARAGGVSLPFTVKPPPEESAVSGRLDRGATSSVPHARSAAATSAASAPGIVAARFVTIDLPGAIDTRAFGINNLGQIVGRFDDAGGTTRGFLRASAGTFRVLEPPGATFTVASDINDAGDVAGRFLDADGLNHAFLWRRGTYLQIDFPGAVETLGRSIDEWGDICGNYVTADGLERGFILDRKGFHDVFLPGSDSTDVWDQIPGLAAVGDWSNTEDVVRGYLLRDGQFRIVDFPGSTVTSIRGLNHLQMIVGEFLDPFDGDHGFVRALGVYRQIDVPGAVMSNANRINDWGAIVGFYASADGAHHAYVLTGWERLPKQERSAEPAHRDGPHRLRVGPQ